ncbi:MAG: flagellar assembly protein FliH [Gammaproteobacteria bacterium]|nr:flagellar assembly protein FliH [Gammaproteobacteria bacterium]
MSSQTSDDKAVEFERWELPDVSSGSNSSRPGHLTAAKLEEIEQQAYEEGLAKGYEEGLAKGLKEGETEIQAKSEQLQQLMESLVLPFQDLDDEVVEQTATLAIAISRQLIRRELHTEPDQVVGIVREGLTALPVSARRIRVYLHPEDAELVRKILSLHDENDDELQTWRIIEEPLMSRGGCKINAENSTIDATVETRLQRVITTIMGGVRADD